MTALSRAAKTTLAVRDACTQSTAVFLRDVGHGLLEVSHNTLALVGLAVVAGALFISGRDDIRHAVETHALGWLQARHDARVETTVGEPAAEAALPASEAAAPAAAVVLASAAESDAVGRATAADPKELTRQQSAVAHWLARRYRVAPEPISRLVKEAWNVAPRVGLDPTLILAIMAIESSFNPFAQSSVGAQGLMQVMTSVHNGKYQRFGGTLAAFDPVSNLKVGVQVLKECIARAGGSVEAGLRYYVGSANVTDGSSGYAGKVLAEQTYLRSVADGKAVAANARAVVPAAVPAAAAAAVAPASPAAAPRDAAAPSKDDEAQAPEQVALAR